MKGKAGGILTGLLFLVGIGLLMYPVFSNWMNLKIQEKYIDFYDEAVAEIPEEVLTSEIELAKEYNQNLLENGAVLSDPFSEEKYVPDSKTYGQLLKVDETSTMGYIEIPKLGLRLAIRHTTDAEVLQTSIGHLEGSSLPVGGEGSHAVLSGHRGLPSAELFTNLDKLEEGDIFFIYVMGTKLIYEVDKISVVLPDDVSDLKITEGKDYVTLLTCTPYLVNSHRLLVRGVRRDELSEEEGEEKERKATFWSYEKKALLTLTIILVGAAAIYIMAGKKKHPPEDSRKVTQEKGGKES